MRFVRPKSTPSPLWCNCHGPFADSLSIALGSSSDVKIEEFHWGGANRIGARREAAIKLAQTIDARYDAGANRIFLVAHSHGGNVAVAASNLTKKPISGLIAMATPFISASDHRSSPDEQFICEAFIKVVVSALIIISVIPLILLDMIAERIKELVRYSSWSSGIKTGIDNVEMAVFIALFVLLLLLWHRLFKRFKTSKLLEWHAEWREYLVKQNLKVKCLVVRASGDEAHAALIFGQILEISQRQMHKAISYLASAIFNRAWRRIFRFWSIVTIFWNFYPALVLMGVINGPDLFELTRPIVDILGPKNDVARITLFLTLPGQLAGAFLFVEYLVAFLVTFVFAIGIALASARFGFDLMIFSPWLDLSVEDGPTDCSFEGLFLSKNAIDDYRLKYRHGIYQIPETTIEVARWINASNAGSTISS